LVVVDGCPKADVRGGGWPNAGVVDEGVVGWPKDDAWPKALGVDGLEKSPKPPPLLVLLGFAVGFANAEGRPNEDDVPKAEVVGCGAPNEDRPNDGVEAEVPKDDGCEGEENDVENALGLFTNVPKPPPTEGEVPNELVAAGVPKAEGRATGLPKDVCPNADVV